MTDNTKMREGKLWAFLHDSIHEAYKKLSTTGTSTEYHTMLDSIASKVADDVDARFLQVAQSEQAVPVEVFDSHCNYASFAGRVCNKCGRIHDGGKSVPVVGEPIYWIDPDDDANLSRISRVGWSPLYGESPASSPAAELARLRENAAEADELRKDAELGECIREKFRLMKGSTAVRFLGCLGVNEPEGGFDWSKTALELIDAAIAQGKGEK